jgi:Tfp pilus assembly protein PilN
VGVPVEPARPRELVALGDIGFTEEELPRLDPYLPAAVGLALGGAGVGTVIDLLPRARHSSVKARRQIAPGAVAAVAAGVVLLGGVSFLAHQSVSSAKSQQASVTNQVTQANSDLARLQPVLNRENQITQIQSNLSTLLATDVAWKTMMTRITNNLPSGITLTAFTGLITPPAPVVAVAPAPAADSSGTGSSSSSDTTTTTTAPPPPTPTITGAITIAGTAKDYPTLAAWIDAMNKVPEIGNVYVTSAQKIAPGSSGAGGVTFTATAVPTPDAQSNRQHQLEKATP